MNEPIRVLPLQNGLSVTVYGDSHRYFGDYFRIEVKIVCRISILDDYFTERGKFVEARSKLGDEVIYSRTEEQMGVPSADIPRTMEKLIANFLEHSLPYISSAKFPRKVVLAELMKASGKGPRTPGL